MIGTLENIWRYPVKSLAPQSLTQTRAEHDGIPGDRATALIVQAGHAREGKPYRGKEHNLLHTTSDPAAAIALGAERCVVLRTPVQPDAHYFDDAPISLVFDRWIAEVEKALEMPLNPLRWRPNFYARAAADFDLSEQDLIGEIIEVGEIVLRVRDTIGRCVTTTYDIETGEQNNDVLLYVAQQRANTMGVYCDVELAGTVRTGDPLRLRAR